jgi:hypothetical protein
VEALPAGPEEPNQVKFNYIIQKMEIETAQDLTNRCMSSHTIRRPLKPCIRKQ